MDLFDVVRACFRRWYVVLPLLLIAGWFSYHTYSSVKPVYYSSSVVGIAPPNSQIPYTEAGAAVSRNGLLDAGGPTLIMNMAIFGLRAPSVVSQVVAAGGKADYSVKMFPVPASSPPLPLLMIEATEANPIDAARTVQLVTGQADSALHAIQQQAGIREEMMVRGLVVSPPAPPGMGVPSRTRSTAAVSVAGVLLAVIVGVLADVLLSRPPARRRHSWQQQSSSALADEATSPSCESPTEHAATANISMGN